MRTIAKLAIGAAMACGAAVAATAPAGAQVLIGSPSVLIGSSSSSLIAAACWDAAGNFIWSSPLCTSYSYSYWYGTPMILH